MSRRPWSVRPFRREDAGELSKIHAAAMGNLGQRGWNKAEIANLGRGLGGYGFVAEAPGSPPRELLGFVLARTVADEAEILTLAVAPKAQRGGIGSALLSRASAEAQERDAVRLLLEVSVDNEPAMALYEREAFSGVGVRRGYYRRIDGGNVDALVLARVFRAPRMP